MADDETLIEITRVFDAPREEIWREWTEPERFADWYGGTEAEIPLDEISMDVRPGGAWQATMYAGPTRRVIEWHGEYVEVVEPERLVLTFTDIPDAEAEQFALVTVVLNDLGDGRTEMLFEQRGPLPPHMVEAARKGWGKFFDRIDARLAEA